MTKSLQQLIALALKVDESRVAIDASMQTIPEWDSLAHMNLVAALEAEFKVRFEPEDLLSMVSVREIVETLNRLGADLD